MSTLLTVLLCAGMALGGLILLIDYRDYRRWQREAEAAKKEREAEEASKERSKRPPASVDDEAAVTALENEGGTAKPNDGEDDR